MTACIAVMVMALQSYNVNHFYDDDDTSNNHTICALDELVDGGGGTTSQAKSNGAMCFTGAMPAIFLVFCTSVIRSVFAIGSR